MMIHLMRGLTRWISWVVLAVFCALLPASTGFAQVIAADVVPLPSASPREDLSSKPSPRQEGLSTSQELANFFNSFLPQAMAENHVPGGVIAVVKDGTLFFTQGYGHANLEQNTPVVPDRTLFRVASISKLFTDTAIMQLYEQGRLNLDKPVEEYLSDLNLENPYPQPVTTATLLTQTDGTSQRLIGIAAPTAARLKPLKQFLAANMPKFTDPPGELYRYSNMGITLAGYLVETLSQTPFAEYIQQSILQPLEMQRSSFQQPLPQALAADLAPGYRYQDDFQAYPFLLLNIAPAASLSATATDIAHFMIAHLQQGRYQNSRILEADTVELMHRQHFTHHPKLPGTAYGFHERLENGLRMIGHAGNMPGYSSSLTLIPEENVGIFVVVNRHAPSVVNKVINQFIERYFPAPNSPVPTVPPALKGRLERFTGTYRDLEYPHDTLAKLSAPFGHLHVKATADNTLSVQTPGLFFLNSTVKRRLTPVAPLLFRRLEDDDYSAFGISDRGEVKHMFNPVNGVIGAFGKVPWYETVVFQLWVGGLSALLLLTAGLIKPIHRLLKSTDSDKTPSWFTRYAHLSAILVGCLYLLPLVSAALIVWWMGGWKLIYGLPWFISLILHLLPIAAVFTMGLLSFSMLAWKRHYWSVTQRVHYSLVTLAAIGFIPFLYYWNFF